MYDDLPLNHPLRHFYRGLAALIGLAMVGFGVTGRHGHPAMFGVTGDLALAIVALLLGLVLVVGSFVWPHLSHLVYLAVGGALMTVGLAMLLLLRTANFFGADMTGCLTTLTVGLVVFMAGTYTRTGTAEEAADKELHRQGGSRPAPARPATARPATNRPATTVPRQPAKAGPRRPAKTAPRRRPASAR